MTPDGRPELADFDTAGHRHTCTAYTDCDCAAQLYVLTEDAHVSRAVIVDVLCGQALADHLGDVRDEERKLWRLLGVDRPVLDHDSAWRNTKATLRAAGIPLPAELDEATG